MKAKIYVVMHKKFNISLPENYEPLLVGSYNKSDSDILRDDSGDNISQKNENYCELTGLYWMWKNTNDDIIGLCHYRRFLSKTYFSNNSKYYLSSDYISELFNKGYNLLLPKKFYYKKSSVKENYNVAPNLNDMKILKAVIKEECSDYLDAFNEYENRQYTYLCNVMITNKEIFNKYCKWLFQVIFKVEKVMDPNDYINDEYRKRMFGFLSERLLNIWVIKNKNDLKIKEFPMICTQEDLKEKIKLKVCQIRNISIYKKR